MRARRRTGLTLAEIVVVMAILIALACIVVPLVGQSAEDARDVVTRTNLTMLRDVILGQYRSDMKEVVLARYHERPASVVRPAVLPRPGYYATHNAVPPASAPRLDRPQLRYLFVNPGTNLEFVDATTETTAPSYDPTTKIGWHGPYVMRSSAANAQLSFGVYRVDVSHNFTRDYGEGDGMTGDPAVLDGWNNPIVLTEVLVENTAVAYTWHVELRSAGPDGTLQTADDVVLLVEDRRDHK